MSAVIATLAGLAGLMIAPIDHSGRDRILEPLRVIECADLVSAPVSLAHRHGRFYVLDPMEQVIVTIAEHPDASHEIQRAFIDLPTPSIYSMFFGCGDVLHLVDPMQRALFWQVPAEMSWRRRELGYRVFFGAGDETGILFNADRHRGEHLVTAVSCDGDTSGLGRKRDDPHPYPSVQGNLNYIRMGVSSDLVVVGHIALGVLLVHRREGVKTAEISLTGPEVVQMRRMYLSSQGRDTEVVRSVERDTLVADLIRAARPGRFPIPVYINDLTVHDGRIWVLCNNTFQVYDPQGSLLARHAVGGRHRGEAVVIHSFCITDRGLLYGLDTAHFHKIYEFGTTTSIVHEPCHRGNEGETRQ